MPDDVPIEDLPPEQPAPVPGSRWVFGGWKGAMEQRPEVPPSPRESAPEVGERKWAEGFQILQEESEKRAETRRAKAYADKQAAETKKEADRKRREDERRKEQEARWMRLKDFLKKDLLGELAGPRGILDVFGMGDFPGIIADAGKAIAGLGGAAVAAGVGVAAFKAGNLLYTLMGGDETWVKHQWEILFGDIRAKGIAGLGDAAKDIASYFKATIQGTTEEQAEKGAKALPARELGYKTMIQAAAPEEMGLTEAEARKLRDILPREALGALQEESAAVQRRVVSDLAKTLREQPERWVRLVKEKESERQARVLAEADAAIKEGRRYVRERGKARLRAQRRLQEEMPGLNAEQLEGVLQRVDARAEERGLGMEQALRSVLVDLLAATQKGNETREKMAEKEQPVFVGGSASEPDPRMILSTEAP